MSSHNGRKHFSSAEHPPLSLPFSLQTIEKGFSSKLPREGAYQDLLIPGVLGMDPGLQELGDGGYVKVVFIREIAIVLGRRRPHRRGPRLQWWRMMRL